MRLAWQNTRSPAEALHPQAKEGFFSNLLAVLEQPRECIRAADVVTNEDSSALSQPHRMTSYLGIDTKCDDRLIRNVVWVEGVSGMETSARIVLLPDSCCRDFIGITGEFPPREDSLPWDQRGERPWRR